MANMSYSKLLEKYNQLKIETKKAPNKELEDMKSKYYYYFNANQKQKEDNEKLKSENKKLNKANIELSYLVTELMRGNK